MGLESQSINRKKKAKTSISHITKGTTTICYLNMKRIKKLLLIYSNP